MNRVITISMIEDIRTIQYLNIAYRCFKIRNFAIATVSQMNINKFIKT